MFLPLRHHHILRLKLITRPRSLLEPTTTTRPKSTVTSPASSKEISSRIFGHPQSAALVESVRPRSNLAKGKDKTKAKGARKIAEGALDERGQDMEEDEGGIEFPRLGGIPEVIITGRANSGKSSLFNAVLGRKDLVTTSKKAGHTRRLDFFRVGASPGKLILVDAPGYGGRGRPEWGELFDSYVRNRRELRRVYITFNAKHALNEYDKEMIKHLSTSLFCILSNEWVDHTSSSSPSPPSPSSKNPTPPPPPPPFRAIQLQPIITKADYLPPSITEAQRVMTQMKKDIEKSVLEAFGEAEVEADSSSGGLIPTAKESARLICLSPIVTSVKMYPWYGIEEVRRNIVEGCGFV